MKKWNRELELALILEDTDKIKELTKTIPIENGDKDELIHASALIAEAQMLISKRKIELSQEMAKLKKTKKFLSNSTNRNMKKSTTYM